MIRIDSTTLTPCAATVAIAAPATFIWNTATSNKSPTILTTQAINTKSNGDLESPNPLNNAEITLYAVMSKNPAPHI